LLDAASIRAVGDVEFRGNFLMCQDEQSVAPDWLVQDV
jgi:hypothetical protein